MDFSNFKFNFTTYKGIPFTIYQWGKKHNELNIQEFSWSGNKEYGFLYTKERKEIFHYITLNIPKLLKIEVMRLYNGFDIEPKDIESFIKNIQAWERRKKK